MATKREKRKKTPKLREIDLKKGTGHFHPDIKPGNREYLCLINGELHVGPFSKQWYGLNFDGWSLNPAGLQFDAPGESPVRHWQRVWEVTWA